VIPIIIMMLVWNRIFEVFYYVTLIPEILDSVWECYSSASAYHIILCIRVPKSGLDAYFQYLTVKYLNHLMHEREQHI